VTFAEWIAARARMARLVVYCHFDADGLAAGALLGRTLPSLGFGAVDVVYSERGESAFSDRARTRLAALAPVAMIVADLGVHRAGVLPGVPTLYVDHHRPEGTPAGEATVISGYAWDPTPNTAWMTYELLAPLADVAPLDWLAAVGTLSDLGDRAPWEALGSIRQRHTAARLKDTVALVNAARRASAFDVATALRLLLEAEGPREIARGEIAGAKRLRAYRDEVNAALGEARRQAPVFAREGPWAVVHVCSPCQVHPLIAQQWRTRLPKHAVIAANRGYLPDLVAFSARTARPDMNLPTLLRAVAVAEGEGHYGHGHDQASGGQLPPSSFDQLLLGLGFGEHALLGAAAAARPRPAPRGKKARGEQAPAPAP
jgi:single-stranded-DNA-specific exonuclease